MTYNHNNGIIINNKRIDEFMYPTINIEKTGRKIENYMRLRHLNVKDIQKALNLTTVQAVYHWINGRCLPSLENLYALSSLFEVSMDELIVGNREALREEIKPLRYNRLKSYYTRFYVVGA